MNNFNQQSIHVHRPIQEQAKTLRPAALATLHFSIKCVACLCIFSFDGFTATLALFSLLTAGAAKVLQNSDRNSACALLSYWMGDEFIEDLMSIGMAGVGALVVLFILA